MPLHSMTGFARRDGSLAHATWHWELRSVNGRGLDIRLRIPNGLDGIEQLARQQIAKRLSRGNVTANLVLQRQANDVEVRLDENNLAQVLAAAEQIRERTGAPNISAEAILTVKGVLEIVEKEEDDDARTARQNAIMADLDHALDELEAARRGEGNKITDLLEQQLSEIETLNLQVSNSPSRKPDAIADRLRGQIEKLVQSSASFEVERLHQEAVLLATKSDIAEEIDRIAAHVSAGRELLAAGSPVGRKLDFLTQEFNREANTLCSKSNDIEITRCGLAMKAIIDQMREQVQNIE